MISAEHLRRIALALPYAVEKPHFDWASFRIDAPKGRIFATLPPHYEFSNIFLSVEEQAMLTSAEPGIFQKVANKWGDKGATSIILKTCDETTLKSALAMSWRSALPPKLRDISLTD